MTVLPVPVVPPRTNLKDEVAAYLRRVILSGQLRPGEKIDQDAVAGQLGVSKLPVREALIALEQEGLVEMFARRGAFVAPLTPEDVLDHYAIFGLVSGLAAQRSAERLDAEERARLRAIVTDMESADGAIAAELNAELHRLINRASHSRRLVSVIGLLAKSLPTGFFSTTPEWSARALEDHKEIVDALERRDRVAAGAAVERHLRHSGEMAVAALHAVGYWEEDRRPGSTTSLEQVEAATPGAC